jgi:hypothetical protein
MKKSIMVMPKKRGRGRPRTGGRDPQVVLRMPADLIKRIEQWAKADGVGRSEAIRRLVELGLKAKLMMELDKAKG